MDAGYTGTKIASYRKALGLTQRELAEKIHVTDKAVSKWERGLNFPDLGIIEALALVLETTPASLLGLETATQNEIVTSMAEVSAEQLENARQENGRTGWVCLLLAGILVLVYQLFGSKEVVPLQRAYQLLHGAITVLIIYGFYLLFKYGQIRKFNVSDLFILYAAVFAVLVFLLHQLLTGQNPPDWLAVCLIAIASCSVQLLFFRIMKPKLVKALPALFSTIYTLWHFGNGYPDFGLCFACCIIIYCLCIVKQREGQ